MSLPQATLLCVITQVSLEALCLSSSWDTGLLLPLDSNLDWYPQHQLSWSSGLQTWIRTLSLVLLGSGLLSLHIYCSCCLVSQSCPTLCNPVDCSTPGFPALHHLPQFAQTHVHWTGNAIQPSHPLSSPSPPALNLSQHHGPIQWVNSLHQVAKVLELQLQCQSFQWILRVNFL